MANPLRTAAQTPENPTGGEGRCIQVGDRKETVHERRFRFFSCQFNMQTTANQATAGGRKIDCQL